MSIYIPDENGELTALGSTVVAETMTQMPPTDLGASAMKMFLGLIFVVVLLFATYWVLKRVIQQKMQRGVGGASIQIIEKRMISPKTVLYLVEVENKKVLLAESQLEIKRLESFEQSPPS